MFLNKILGFPRKQLNNINYINNMVKQNIFPAIGGVNDIGINDIGIINVIGINDIGINDIGINELVIFHIIVLRIMSMLKL